MSRSDLHYAVQRLWPAACNGSREAMLQLHEICMPLHHPVYADGSTLLHDICSRGCADDAAFLIHLIGSDQADPAAVVSTAVNVHNKQQRTPLWLAARSGNPQLLSILLEAGADPMAAADDGTYPLHLAAASGSLEAVQVLLAAGAPLAAQAQDKRTALDWALAAIQPAVAQGLLDAGGPEQLEGRSVHTRLLLACLLGQEQQAVELLGAGVTPHAMTCSGVRALELAVRAQAAGIVKALVARGAIPTAPCSLGGSLLQAAVAWGYAEVVQELVVPLVRDAAAQPALEDALHTAVACGHASVVGALLKAGVAPTCFGSDGLPPLHRAILHQHGGVAEVLLSWPAVPRPWHPVNPGGSTPRGQPDGSGAPAAEPPPPPAAAAATDNPSGVPGALATASGSAPGQQVAPAVTAAGDEVPGVQEAVASSPLLQQHDKKGQSALYLAAAVGALDMVQLLVGYGASCTSTDSNGSSALHVAAARGHVTTFNYMLHVECSKVVAGLEEEEAEGLRQQSKARLDLLCDMLEQLQQDPEPAAGAQQQEEAQEPQAMEVLLGAEQMEGPEQSIDWDQEVSEQEEWSDQGEEVEQQQLSDMDDADDSDSEQLQQSEEGAFSEEEEQLEQTEEEEEEAEGSEWSQASEQSEDSDDAHDWEEEALQLPPPDPHLQARWRRQYKQKCRFKNICDIKDASGATLLHCASAAGSADIVKALLAAGAEPLWTDNQELDVLCYAAYSGSAECVRLLLDGEVPIEWGLARGWVPLHLAAKHGHDAVVATLLAAGANPAAATQLMVTPLHLAAAAGHGEVVGRLVAAGAPLDAVDACGSTPLHLACQNRHQGVAQQLVEAGADPGLADGAGRTAMHLWWTWNDHAMYQLLTAAALEDHSIVCKVPGVSLGYGTLPAKHLAYTFEMAVRHVLGVQWMYPPPCGDLAPGALRIAAAYGHSQVVSHLLAVGYSPLFVDTSGRTLLHVAAAHGHYTVLAVLLEAIMAVSPHLLHSLDHGSLKQPRSSPLHLAAQYGNAGCVAALLEAGANPNQLDSNGATPLHRAVASGRVYLVEQLATPANVNMVAGGRTALHAAVAVAQENEKRSVALVAALLGKGALTQVFDQEGRTPLARADAQGSALVASLLLLMQAAERHQLHVAHQRQRRRDGVPALSAACTGNLPTPELVAAARRALHHTTDYRQHTLAVFSKVLASHGPQGTWQLLQSLLKPYQEYMAAKGPQKSKGPPFGAGLRRLRRLVEVLVYGWQSAFHDLLQQQCHVMEPLQHAARQMLQQQEGHNVQPQPPAAAAAPNHQQQHQPGMAVAPVAAAAAEGGATGSAGAAATGGAQQQPAVLPVTMQQLSRLWSTGRPCKLELRAAALALVKTGHVALALCVLESLSVQRQRSALHAARELMAKVAGVRDWSELRQRRQGLYRLCEALLAAWQCYRAQQQQGLHDAVVTVVQLRQPCVRRGGGHG